MKAATKAQQASQPEVLRGRRASKPSGCSGERCLGHWALAPPQQAVEEPFGVLGCTWCIKHGIDWIGKPKVAQFPEYMSVISVYGEWRFDIVARFGPGFFLQCSPTRPRMVIDFNVGTWSPHSLLFHPIFLFSLETLCKNQWSDDPGMQSVVASFAPSCWLCGAVNAFWRKYV